MSRLISLGRSLCFFLVYHRTVYCFHLAAANCLGSGNARVGSSFVAFAVAFNLSIRQSPLGDKVVTDCRGRDSTSSFLKGDQISGSRGAFHRL
jgi:hypothetical protein